MSDVKHTPGPYRAIGSAIYADAPQDVNHSHFKGFGEPEPDRGYLIAESIPHKPTRDLLTAAPTMLEALKAFASLELPPLKSAGNAAFYSLRLDDIRKAKAAISFAQGEASALSNSERADG